MSTTSAYVAAARAVALFTMAVLVVASPAAAGTEPADSSRPTPTQLVDRLQAATTAGAEATREALVTELAVCGEAALPAIEVGLGRKDERLSYSLVRVLTRIEGDGATSLLVGLLKGKPDAMPTQAAVGSLSSRPIRRALTAAELNTLTQLVKQDDAVGAGIAANALVRCLKVALPIRLRPVLARFAQEVTSDAPRVHDGTSYVSPRVRVLQQFLLAFFYVGKPAIDLIAAEREKAEQPELRKWLGLALGHAGDARVGKELEGLVRDDPDRYVRSAAIYAYARAMGQDAVPLLQSLLTDTTVSEYHGCVGTEPIYLLRWAAQGELARLKREAAAAATSPPAPSP